ncbi:hypothetical protein KDA_49070 [Dictyobacter alpinus]|uniref:Uncharacterized protein n=1 Tax=Dictyobacter alpinus TaxID=2014873 RepID=A0A402BDE5_9CHLR|nr:hypothetical protein KDA_49070 [Dictyobacter alpinus]
MKGIPIEQCNETLALCQQVAPVIIAVDETFGQRRRYLQKDLVPPVQFMINERLGV